MMTDAAAAHFAPPSHRLTRNEAGAARLAEAIAARLEPGDTLRLTGEIGAGKSHLARAIIRALLSDDAAEVPSPTFTLVQTYDEGARVPVWHADLYRLNDPAEAAEIGLEAALDEGVLIVEWPERGEGALPPSAAVLDIAIGGEGEVRDYALTGTGSWETRLARLVETDAFLDRAGRAGSRRFHVVGDASTRRYERLEGDGAAVLLMDAPPPPPAEAVHDDISPAAGTLDYARTVGLARDIAPFLAVAGALTENGFPAPLLPAWDAGAQLALVEDFGLVGVAQDGRAVPERYEASVDLLAVLHETPWGDTVEGHGVRHTLPRYGAAALRAELAQYPTWFDRSLDEAAFLDAWTEALHATLATPPTLVLRDYHSPNIMWRRPGPWRGALGLLDFQDACLGPAAYDVASLVQDARVDLDDGLEQALTARYLAARPSLDPAAFRRDLAVMGAQRATKVLGAFRRLAQGGKPGYLAHIPRVAAALRRNLAHPALETVRPFYTALDSVPDTDPA